MIKQILERDFMLKSAETLQLSLGETIQSAETSPALKQLLDATQVTKVDLAEAHAELVQAIQREELRPQEKEDPVAFFPRDPLMSIAQSSLQQYCETRKADQIVERSDEIRAASSTGEIPVAEKELSGDLQEFLSETRKQRLFSDFELADIGWANCTLAAGIRSWRGRYPFNDKPSTPYRIGNNARVILFSDWGSGLPRAQKVSQEIRKALLDPAAANRDKHVIHMGDVYYSGWAKEYEANFLPYWPVNRGEEDRVSSWTMNANHDMYSGGKGYFDYLLSDVRFKAQENSSFFSLENDQWLLLALDTGYHTKIFDPHDLYGAQDEWVRQRLNHAGDKTGILLSHHQPFSAYEKGGEKILEKLQTPLNQGLIRAWFWGHEHRCTFYQGRENIEYARCIGHGGIPFYVTTGALPADRGVIYEYRDGFDDLLETWNYFGFVILDFDGDKIHARYLNERGDMHREETITRQ